MYEDNSINLAEPLTDKASSKFVMGLEYAKINMSTDKLHGDHSISGSNVSIVESNPNNISDSNLVNEEEVDLDPPPPSLD